MIFDLATILNNPFQTALLHESRLYPGNRFLLDFPTSNGEILKKSFIQSNANKEHLLNFLARVTESINLTTAYRPDLTLYLFDNVKII